MTSISLSHSATRLRQSDIVKNLLLLFFKKAVLLPLGLLSGCIHPHHCPLSGQSPMVVVDLYFGRAMPDGGVVRDADWDRFAAAEITPRFPDGFTVFDARGQWMNPATRTISREASRVVRIAVLPANDVAGRVAAVAAAYRHRFRQDSVGVVSSEACGRF